MTDYISKIKDSKTGKIAYLKDEETRTQLNDITNKVDELKNNSGVTDTQIDNAVTKYLTNNPVSGGMTTTAKNLLITILQNAVYTTNQSANINTLINAISTSEGGGDTPTTTKYTITNTLTNCINSNTNNTVVENTNYTANITANKGYKLSSVTVTMGGKDITSSCYSNGVINITNVTGNVVITANASEVQQQEATLPTDGLVSYFDFRNCKYNNNGSGGSTLISATQGNGGLYCWAKNMVTEQDQYGIKSGRALVYSKQANSTAEAKISAPFTIVMKSYMTAIGSPLFTSNYGSMSNIILLAYKPSYNNGSTNVQLSAQELTQTRHTGYNTLILRAEDSNLKLYLNNTLIKEIDGSTISDFVKWADVGGFGILGGNTLGYYTQIAIYNKALSDVDITEIDAYLKSLEVK